MPRSTTLSGMTFQVSPPWICVTLTTALSSGWVLRLAIVCSPLTICAAATTGSTPRCGIAACAPRPFTVISKMSNAAIIGPDWIANLPGRQPRPVVHAEDRFDRIFVEDTFFDHEPRAAFVLLGRLEDEMHRAGEIARLGEMFGGAEQHRGMAVMAAGMHPARAVARHGGSRSSHGCAARPYRRARRSRGPRAPTRAACRRRRCAAMPRVDREAERIRAARRRTSAVRCSSKAVSGWAWNRCRQAAISAWKSAMRLMIGIDPRASLCF